MTTPLSRTMEELKALRSVAQAALALRARMEQLRPAVDSAFLMASVHGVKHDGGDWAEECKALDAAMAALRALELGEGTT